MNWNVSWGTRIWIELHFNRVQIFDDVLDDFLNYRLTLLSFCEFSKTFSNIKGLK